MKFHHAIHAHLKQHHKKYVGGLFAGFAVVKMFVLLIGFFSILTHGGTFADDGYCGDGIVQGIEVCDNGENNGQPGYCNVSCDGTVPEDNGDPGQGGGDIYGCTDPAAINYDVSATMDDGNCMYDTTDVDIIDHYYGLSSSYTANRTGNVCSTGAMTVEYIRPGSVIPQTLSENTIYVLLSGTHIVWSQINMATCSAIIGSGDVTIYSDVGRLGGMLAASAKENIIIDHISIDGWYDGNGSMHPNEWKNYNGILLQNHSNNNTINDVTIYNNTYRGVFVENSDNNTITNSKFHDQSQGVDIWHAFNTKVSDSTFYNDTNGINLVDTHATMIDAVQAYNNQYGIIASETHNMVINNSLSYNNSDAGIYLFNSANNAINNTQTFNSYYGIVFMNSNSNHNTINNTQIYNNTYGIEMNNSANNVLNNIGVYNNQHAIDTNAENNTYYGDLKIFGNNDNTLYLTIGVDTETFSGGNQSSIIGGITCDRVTNPMNADGNFLMTTDRCDQRGNINTRSGYNIKYLYGTHIPKQVEPLQDNGAGVFDYSFSALSWIKGAYAAEINKLIDISLVLNDGNGGTTDPDIHAEATTTEPVDCEVIGDFVGSPITGVLEDTLASDITLTPGYGIKNVSLSCSTGDRTRIITKTIKYADPAGLPFVYYGSGSKYTTNRTTNTCDPTTMDVVYVDSYETTQTWSTLPNTLAANTMYVLLSGAHISYSTTKSLSDCTAIVGSGYSSLHSFADVNAMLSANGKKNIIIDGISLDGQNAGQGSTHYPNSYGIVFTNHSTDNTVYGTQVHKTSQGIYIDGSSNNTIDTTQVYDTDYGIHLSNYATGNIVTNTQVYRNYDGLYLTNYCDSNVFENIQAYSDTYGIFLDSSNNNILNNIQSYNNGYDGIYLQSSSNNNTINNTQVYNNQNGLHMYGSNNNTMNNFLAYNDVYGVYLEANSTGNRFNTTQLYNDGYGIYLNSSSDNSYYGTFKVFDNAYNFVGDTITEGLASEFLSGGVVDTRGTISCDLVTNPKNANGIYLINETNYPSCDLRGRNSQWTATSGITYLYGMSINTQTQALQDVGSGEPVYSWSEISFDPASYIGKINPLLNGSLSFVGPDQIYTFNTGTQIALHSSEFVDYELSGDFVGSPRSGALASVMALNMTFTPGYGTKHFSVTYTTGDQSKTFNKSIVYTDPNGLPFTYFGSGSTYTTHRLENTCEPALMNVEYIDAGTNTLPETLTGNTIYVLLSGVHITTDSIRPENCSAIVGSGNVTLYMESAPYQATFWLYGKENIIIDNVAIDGGHDGLGNTHSQNYNGVRVDSSSSSTITHIQSYHHAYHGVYLGASSYITINNVQSFGNGYGISLENTSHSLINTVQTYKNGAYGIYLYDSSNNILNNAQSYNNDRGIYIQSAYNNTINNSQSYNNNEGIDLYHGSNTTINNSQLYNNAGDGLSFTYSFYTTIVNSQFYNNYEGIYSYPNGSPNAKYYGTIKVFDNTININVNEQLSAGDDSEFFSGGLLQENTESMSCNRITNPMDIDGSFLIDETEHPNCDARGIQNFRIGASDISYLYGLSINKQLQAIGDAGTIYTSAFSLTSLSWDVAKYIAEISPLLNGSLTLAGGQSSTLATGIQLQMTVATPANYELFGDFEGSPLMGVVTGTTTIDIAFTSGYGTKNISVVYSTGDKTRTINKHINYVDPNGLPFTYFGSGSTYTTQRAQNTCNPADMTVAYIEPGTDTIPNHLSENTVYVLSSGNYLITSDYIYPAHCSALVGSGDVTLYSNGYFNRIVFFYQVTNAIVDTIKIDGRGFGDGNSHYRNYAGIQLSDDASNNTIHNVQSHDSSYGLVLESYSNNNEISDAQLYNNDNYGASLSNSNSNIFTDIQSYNNNEGFHLDGSTNNVLNNIQTYNNNYGMILYYSSNNVINNTQAYNNGYGLYIQYSSNNNTIHNSSLYNNEYGVNIYNASNNVFDGVNLYDNNNGATINRNSWSNTYYGTTKVFANNSDINGSISAGEATDFLSGGVLDTEGIMSCDWITNPMNANEIFLVDESNYPNCDQKGKNYSWSVATPTKYLYGMHVSKQSAVLQDTGEGTPAYVWSDVSFDTDKYIAQVNPLLNGSLVLIPHQSYTTNTGIQIQLVTANLVNYELSGDFEGSPLTGTISNLTTLDVPFSSGYGVKTFRVVYTTGASQRTITKTIGYISSIDKYCEQLVTDIPVPECEALVALYTSTDGDNWYDNSNWLGNGDTSLTTACDWYGVGCGEGEGHVYDLSLDENNLSGALPVQISNLNSLSYVDLRYNNITSIEGGTFSGLLNLSDLYLNYNQITSIESGTFVNLPSLGGLYLSHNQIVSIANGAFVDIPYLYYLYLDENTITALQNNTFANIPSLEELYLNDNHIVSIESGTFAGLSDLSYLYLDNNQITSLEDTTFADLSSLEELDLSYNNITSLGSGTFVGLSNLYYLYLYNNQIVTLDANIFSNLSNLEQLNLSYNRLSSIESGAFAGLSNLYNLRLDSNSLVSLEDYIFSDLSNLQELNLSDNTIISVKSGAFVGLSNLSYLYLNDNQIASIGLNTFNDLPSLMSLYINNNQIAGSLDIFCSLTSLNQLIADHNRFADEIPSCLTSLPMNRGGNIAYNYLNTDISDSDFVDHLNNYFRGRWNQYMVADLVLSGTIDYIDGNTFTLHLGYQNNGPQDMDSNIIYYDKVDGMDIQTDTEYSEERIGTTYPGFGDPCFDEWYNSGTGPYQDFFDQYARNYDEYSSFAEMMNDREGYNGDSSGVGKWFIDYVVDDDGPISDWRQELVSWFDDWNADIGLVPNCGSGGRNVYVFDVGYLASGDAGTIDIAGIFSNDLKNNGFSNSLNILSTNELRSDNHIRNNRFGFSYDAGIITIDDTSSLFPDLADNAIIVTSFVDMGDGNYTTPAQEISIRSANIEAVLPPNTTVISTGLSCLVNELLAPQDMTDQFSGVLKAFKIGSACTGTSLFFSNPVSVRIYMGSDLGETINVKVSTDGITRDDITGTRVSDMLYTYEIVTNHFSYFKIPTQTPVDNTPVENPPSSSHGSGGPAILKDACPVQRDCSDSYYDRICGPCPLIDTKPLVHGAAGKEPGSIVGSLFSLELNNAYLWSYGYNITTMPTIQRANMNGPLLRKDMAKMISNFAINVMGKNVSTGVKCDFLDMKSLSKETQYYAIAACRLGLMGYESDGVRVKHTFDPNVEVDRAQFGTILSRLIRGTKNNGGVMYYTNHLSALKTEGIMTKIATPNQKELRGRVMVMLKRVFDKK
ncbi:MAG: right-handed parallel beta-helix repeat-containing protein [candidate division SR1 bacterium]|nr:right-handed parallel beta-helix repeat-containing protein [candidate division SR1 bacterium]